MQQHGELPEIDADGFVTNLGADNDSEIEVRRPQQSKAFAVIDRRSSSLAMLATRKSTGKLVRPTRPEARVLAAPRLVLNPGGQRKLHGPARDPLAFDATPMRPVLAPRTAQPAQFSPTRKRKQQARSVEQPAELGVDPGAQLVMDEPEQAERAQHSNEPEAEASAHDLEDPGQAADAQDSEEHEQVAGAQDSEEPEREADAAEVEQDVGAQEPPRKRHRHQHESERSTRRSIRLYRQELDAVQQQDVPVPRLKPGPVANRASLFPEGDTVDDLEAEVEGLQHAQTLQPKRTTQKPKLVPKIRSTHVVRDHDGGPRVGSSNRPASSMVPPSSRGDDSRATRRTAECAEIRPGSSKRHVIDGDVTEDDGEDEVRLYGQESKLNDIYLALREIGWSYRDGEKYERAEVDLEDSEVKILKKLCRKAKQKLQRALKQRPSDRPDDAPCMDELSEIELGLQELHANPAYHKSRTKMKNIYFYLIPSLIRLLKEIIHYFHIADDLSSTRSSLTIPHVRLVVSLMTPIVRLRDTLEKYPKPDGLNVARPVKNGIFLPLSQVRQALQLCLSNYDRRVEYARQRERDAARHAADEERFAAAELEAQRKRAARAEWHHLHKERRHCEGYIGIKKMDHLAVPPVVDIDQNGEPFERVSVFGPRIGPSPSKTMQARQHPWDKHELAALEAGLKEFAGPDVYIKIFRAYCCQHGVLNRYNVTEIVTKAADLIGFRKKKQMKKQGYVEDWLEEIYLWTAPWEYGDGGRGQENRVASDQMDA